MDKINKITKDTFDQDWDILLEDYKEFSQMDHRRGSTFYVKRLLEINEEFFPELDRKYDGFWESNEYIWSEEDYDRRDIIEFNRVELVEKIVTTKEWKLVI